MNRRLITVLAIGLLAGSPMVWASGQGDAAAKAGVVSLDFMAIGAQTDQEMFQKLIDGFNKSQPAVKLNYLPLPENSWTKVRALFAGGTAPDVIRVNDDDVYDLATQNQIVHLDPYIDKYLKRSDYFDAAFRVLSVGGKMYSANIAFGTNVLHYNVAMVKDAGLAFPADWKNTWEWSRFVADMAKLTVDANKDGRPEVYGVGYPLNIITPFMFSNGTVPVTDDNTRANFVQDKIIDILTEFQALSVKHHYAPFIEEDKRVLFNSKKLVAIWDNEGIKPAIQQGIEWDVAPMPKAREKALSVSYVRSFAIPKTSKHPDEAFRVYAYFMGPEGQKTLVEWGYGVPVLRSAAQTVFAAAAVPKHRAIYADALDYEAPMPKSPLGAVWKKQQTAIGPELINGTMTPREFLQRIQSEMDNRIRELQRR